MAMSKIAAVFTANTSGLVAGTKTAGAAFDKLAADVKGLRSGLNTLTAISGAQLFGQIASGVSSAVQSLYGMSVAASDTIDNLSKLGARTGQTYGEIAGLALAGDLAGVGVDTIANALTKADRAFVLAAQGSKTATKAFAGIGLSLDDLQGKSGSERFQLIAQAISQLPTEAERAAASIALFGKSGAELLPLFAGGAAGIQEATAQAERFGLALTNVQGTNVEKMNDSWTLVQKAVEGVVTQITANLAPAVTAINEALTNFVSGFGGANIGAAIADGILSGAEYLAGVADYIIANIPEVFKYAEGVGAYWNTVVDLFGRAVSAAELVFKSFEIVGNTIGRVLANIAAGFLEIVARAAEVVPGLGDFAAAARRDSAGWEEQAAAYGRAMRENMGEAGRLFADTFGDRTKAGAEAVAGPVTTAFRGIRADIERARTAPDVATKTTIEPKTPPEVKIDEAKLAKGIDARSTAGVNEMLRLMTPDAGKRTYDKENADNLARIADNTADMGLELVEQDF
jgi:hypothetical protein